MASTLVRRSCGVALLLFLPLVRSFSISYGVHNHFPLSTAARDCSVKTSWRKGAVSKLAMTQKDLLVVGAGVLGGLLVKQHKEKFPEAKIIAETR